MRPLRITTTEYSAIVRQIEAVLPPGTITEPRRHYPGYGDYDAFYDARGRYTAANTCNQWTSNTRAISLPEPHREPPERRHRDFFWSNKRGDGRGRAAAAKADM